MEYNHHPDAHKGSSELATAADLGPRYTVGNGGMEFTPSGGLQTSFHGEHSNAPAADPQTGLIFKTESGSPVPMGGPRPHDLVVIGGMPTKVANAVRLGLIPDPSLAPQGASQVQQQVIPQQALEEAPKASPTLADTFTAEVLPKVSPMAREELMKGIAEGQFSELALDYLQLEGTLPLSEISATRDAYAAKVTAATGMDEGELEELFNTDRAGFTQAAQELLKTGSTSAFQSLAKTAEDASYVPLSNDEAMFAWTDHDEFISALNKAGIVPDVSGDELAINVPGHGVVKWTEAVQRGLVKVSRN